MIAHRAAILAAVCSAGALSCDSGSAGSSSAPAVAFVSAEPVVYDFALPELRLVDQRGKAVTRSDLTGKVLVVNFIFTTCPTVCPRLSERMAKVGKELETQSDVMLVSITVDPENDTPEKLAAYGARYGA